jgi:hypothetical protein
MRLNAILVAMGIVGSAALAAAQTMHANHGAAMGHVDHGAERAFDGVELTEPGQGAFAALSEVVSVLEADPETDWSRVDLAGLRAHLVDMDRVILEATVTETALADGLFIVATGEVETVASLRRMVPAHAAQLAQDDRWTVEAAELENGVELRVSGADPEIVARIQGLGFFGLMASQDHHREHHLKMARGENVHVH